MQLSTNTVIVHGKQGGGKTIFSVLLASDFLFGRIFGNVNISLNNNPQTMRVDNIEVLESFNYSPTPGIILFDEMGLNFNSKNASSAKNMELSKFFFLVRKFNLSSVFISQRFGSIPVDMRELADYIFEIKSIYRKGKHPIFSITRQSTDNEGNLVFEEERQFDIIKYLQSLNISYNTLEASIIS